MSDNPYYNQNVRDANFAALQDRGRAQLAANRYDNLVAGVEGASRILGAFTSMIENFENRSIRQKTTELNTAIDNMIPELARLPEHERAEYIQRFEEQIQEGSHEVLQGYRFPTRRSEEEFQRLAAATTAQRFMEMKIQAVQHAQEQTALEIEDQVQSLLSNGNTFAAMRIMEHAIVHGEIDTIRAQQIMDVEMREYARNALYQKAYEIHQEQGERAAHEFLNDPEALKEFAYQIPIDFNQDGEVNYAEHYLEEEDVDHTLDRLKGRISDERRMYNQWLSENHTEWHNDLEYALNNGQLSREMLENSFTETPGGTRTRFRELHPDLYARYSTILAQQNGDTPAGFSLVREDPRFLENVYAILRDRDISDPRKGILIRDALRQWQADHTVTIGGDEYVTNLGIEGQKLNDILKNLGKYSVRHDHVESLYQRIDDAPYLTDGDRLRLTRRLNEQIESGISENELMGFMDNQIERAIIEAAAKDRALQERVDETDLEDLYGEIANPQPSLWQSLFRGGENVTGVRPRNFDDHERLFFQTNNSLRSFEPGHLHTIAQRASLPGESFDAEVDNWLTNVLNVPRDGASQDQIIEAHRAANAIMQGRTVRRKYVEETGSSEYIQTVDPRSGETVLFDYSQVSNLPTWFHSDARTLQDKVNYLIANHPDEIVLRNIRNSVDEYEDDRVTPRASTLEWHARTLDGAWLPAAPDARIVPDRSPGSEPGGGDVPVDDDGAVDSQLLSEARELADEIISYRSSSSDDISAMMAFGTQLSRHGVVIDSFREAVAQDFLTDDQVELLRNQIEGVRAIADWIRRNR